MVAASLLMMAAVTALAGTAAFAGLPGATAQLTRAPYLTDLTTSSVQVSWATTTSSRGVVRFGPAGSCTANAVTSLTLGNPITVNGSREYQNSVTLDGLAPGGTYCYRVYTGDAVPVDLLGSNVAPRFTTMEQVGSATPFTFGVFGDWGDTTNSGVNNGAVNANQAALDAQIAASGARFVVSTGDVGYPGGTQNNYGDLNQTGDNLSAVFGPSYWAVPGQSVPLHGVSGNHGQNSTFLSLWPQSASAAASGGVYSMVNYPSIQGTTANAYPTSYYAFSTGGIRFYVLDAAWADGNVGDATGGACGSHCRMYEIDRQAHWTAASAQYQWLAQDLAAHPGGLKFAAFHYPLRSDDSGEPGDEYLQHHPGSSGSIEQLLHDGGVQLVFNGHAHIYQRNVAPPGGVVSYVSGGGGARVASIGGHGCLPTDAYGIGWSYTKDRGNACGTAAAPVDDAEVYHFLKVSVVGTTVTVTPTDSRGRTFDVQTYELAADTAAPGAPGNLTATSPNPASAAVDWTAATDNIGVSAYDIYRNGVYLETVPPGVTAYTDVTVVAGAGYTYEVRARDLAGNERGAMVTLSGGGVSDTTAPTAPTGLAAQVVGPTSVSLSWAAATDNVGIATYTILRGGSAVTTIAGNATSWLDTGLIPGTVYTYKVLARDAAGNQSPPSETATATTQADTAPPSTPGTPARTSATSTRVAISWAASTDNVGVVRYDVLRGGAVVGVASGTTFADTTVTPGTTYGYAVRAVDAAGNSSTSGVLMVTTPTSGSVLFDGFESAGLAQWSTVSGLVVQSSIVHNGNFAARETSTGTATYAYQTLPGAYTELWAQVWVYVVSRSTSANLFGFRTSAGGSIVNVYLDPNGRVSLRNNAGGVTTNSTTALAAGGWHRVVLHAIVNGTSSSLDVSLDGALVAGLTLSGQDLGASPIGRLQLGETTAGRTYDVIFDDVTVAPSAL